MPEPADEERRLTPAEIGARQRARRIEFRKGCAYFLVLAAHFSLPLTAYMGWVLVPAYLIPAILAFLIWPKPKSQSRPSDKESQ